MYIYIIEYSSVIKKNEEILPFAAKWTDLEGITLSEVEHSEKDILCDITYMLNLKNIGSEYNKKLAYR